MLLPALRPYHRTNVHACQSAAKPLRCTPLPSKSFAAFQLTCALHITLAPPTLHIHTNNTQKTWACFNSAGRPWKWHIFVHTGQAHTGHHKHQLRRFPPVLPLEYTHIYDICHSPHHIPHSTSGWHNRRQACSFSTDPHTQNTSRTDLLRTHAAKLCSPQSVSSTQLAKPTRKQLNILRQTNGRSTCITTSTQVTTLS
jgi:hypothetical protein